MCLDKLKQFPVKKNYGWKVFVKEGNGLYPMYRSHGNTPFPVNEWHTDKRNLQISLVFDEAYRTGFHLFYLKRDARAYALNHETIRKTYFRGIVTTGTQASYHAVVAREIYIEDKQ